LAAIGEVTMLKASGGRLVTTNEQQEFYRKVQLSSLRSLL
jgi:hypothetical protein